MNKIMTKFGRLERIRQLHTIISQETIKPSSPTPHHLKTHNLSLIDQFTSNIPMSLIFFYRNYNIGDTYNLKQSLSESLTRYYPFAGTFPTPSSPAYIECNDRGAEFYEASIDSRIDDVVFKETQDETLDQLVPNGLGCIGAATNLVEVQLNRFVGGGAAIAVSISHKIADALTMVNFVNDWATATRGESPTNPSFIPTLSCEDIKNLSPTGIVTDKDKYITRRFVFSNSILNELKNKVSAQMNPTRVEVLTSFLYRCIVMSSTKSPILLHPVDIRNKIITNCPKIVAGNVTLMVGVVKKGEIKLNEVVGELRKAKMELDGLSHMQQVGNSLMKTGSMFAGGQSQPYIITSMCRLPLYEADFGSEKPIQVTLRYPDVEFNIITLLDTPSGDGIEALVRLPKNEMDIFQMDKDLLALTC